MSDPLPVPRKPLSAKALEERKPLPPEILASAEDHPCPVLGRGRPVVAGRKR